MGLTSLLKFLLWIFSITLTLFVAAMSVTPQMAGENIEAWLGLIGFKSGASWFTAHAHHRVHLSPDTIKHAWSGGNAHSGISSGVDVPDVVLMALAALVLALVLIWWISSRRPRSLLAS